MAAISAQSQYPSVVHADMAAMKFLPLHFIQIIQLLCDLLLNI